MESDVRDLITDVMCYSPNAQRAMDQCMVCAWRLLGVLRSRARSDDQQCTGDTLVGGLLNALREIAERDDDGFRERQLEGSSK